MSSLLEFGLSNALMALLLAFVAVAVRGMYNRPALVHGLWLLVLLKLLTPPLFLVPVRLPAEAVVAASMPAASLGPAATIREPDSEELAPANGNEEGPTTAEPELLPPARGEPENPAEDGVLTQGASTELLDESAGDLPLVGTKVGALGWSWPGALVAIWLSGSALWFGLAAYRVGRFHRLLEFARPAPREVQKQTANLARRLGLTWCPGVWLVPGPVSPMLWAIGRAPRLLLPADLLKRLSERQLATLLTHELAHLRRRDHWVRVVELVVTGLYWWHPVVWWARRELREAEEQCCDAWVVWVLPQAARTYALALLETVDYLADAPLALPPAASGVGRLHILRRRLTMIMRGTTPKALTWAGCLAVLGLGTVLLPLAPSWAQVRPEDGRRDEDRRKAEERERLERMQKEIREREVQLSAEEREEAAQLQKARAELARALAQLQGEERERARQLEKARDELAAAKRRLEEAQARMAELEGRRGEGDNRRREDPDPRRGREEQPRPAAPRGGGGGGAGIGPGPGGPPAAGGRPAGGSGSAGPGMPGAGGAGGGFGRSVGGADAPGRQPGGGEGAPGGMRPTGMGAGMPGFGGGMTGLGGMGGTAFSPGDTQRRLADLEKKMDTLLREMSELRRDMRRAPEGERRDERIEERRGRSEVPPPGFTPFGRRVEERRDPPAVTPQPAGPGGVRGRSEDRRDAPQPPPAVPRPGGRGNLFPGEPGDAPAPPATPRPGARAAAPVALPTPALAPTPAAAPAPAAVPAPPIPPEGNPPAPSAR